MRSPPRTTLACIASLAVVVLGFAACGGGRAPAGSSTGDPRALPSAGAPSAASATCLAGDGPLSVFLLGGSSARECIVSNADWSAQLERLLGREVRAADLAATTQSYTHDIRLVRGMEEKPTLVVIGVGLGRYTSPPPELDDELTPDLARALRGEVEVEHGYDARGAKPPAAKERLLEIWLAERYPLFRRNYAANQADLERLLRACRERGFVAALLELPLNLDAVDGRLDVAREQYTDDCRRLAARYQVPFLTFVDELDLRDASFYDLMHLLEPGRMVWQARLSRELADLLDGSDDGG